MSIDRKKYMSLEEVRQLRQATARWSDSDMKHGRRQGPLAWLLVDVALSTGLRVSEIARITIDDLDAKRSLLTVTRSKKREKTGKTLEDPKTGKRKPEYKKKEKAEPLNIGQDLCRHVREYIDTQRPESDSRSLWIGKRGPLTPQGLEVLWKSAVASAGMKTPDGSAIYSIHAARHTMGYHLLRKTRNLRQVQKQLGHENPATTANMYTDVSDDDMRDGVTGLYDG
jgi:integrase